MSINIEKLRKLIEIFYQPPFKIFYVNSTDETNFCQPIGVFVSLGITTSPKVIKAVENMISLDENYSTKLAEISSKLINGTYLNTVTKVDNIEQFTVNKEKYPDNLLDKTESLNKLEELKSTMKQAGNLENLQETAVHISVLQNLINRFDTGNLWESQYIWEDENTKEFKPFHTKLNYIKEDNIERRIGIFVTDK